MEILESEHVFIAGQTGTGKSVLAEIYLAGMGRVIKLDTKGEYYERKKKGLVQWRGLKEGTDFTIVFKLSEIDDVTTPKIIYVPSFQEMTIETYDELMKYVYQREDTILWIDELMEVAPSAFKYPPYLKGLYTRGRSKNVAVWACTQRPSDIPAICLANSSHYFIFAMQLPSDREKIAKATGQPEFFKQPTGYDFYYWKIGTDKAVLAALSL